jgi:branched-chain amino acid transport system permease protein
MRRNFLILLIGVAVLAPVPFLADNYLLRLATTALMYASLALAWNMIGGFAGYPSFGLAAFFGLGAYATGILQTRGFPAPLAWMAAVVAGTVFAFALGAIVLRMRGHAFAITTLVVAEVLREITNAWNSLTGGGMGINMPFQGIEPIVAARFYFFAMLACAALALAATIIIAGSRLGFALRTIKQNEDAASMVGVNTTKAKVVAFAVSAGFAAFAGGIYASWISFIEPTDVYDILFSIKPIVMVLLGGAGTVFGPIIGAALFLLLDEIVWRNFLETHTGILGLVIVLLILYLPTGVSGLSWLRLGHRSAS